MDVKASFDKLKYPFTVRQLADRSKKHALTKFFSQRLITKNMEKINPFDKLRVNGEQRRTIKSFFRNILKPIKALFNSLTKSRKVS